MEKTVSGSFNLNTVPRSFLTDSSAYRGRPIPTVSGYFRYAGLLAENPQDYAFDEVRLPTLRRQARPYGIR